MAYDSPIDRQEAFFRGQDYSLAYTVRTHKTISGVYTASSETWEDWDIQDITGMTFEWVLRDANNAAITLLTVTPTITSGTSGTLAVAIADTDTDTIPAGRYAYMLRRTGAGTEIPVAYGVCVLRESMARS